ncbi:MAG TPA: hypothetical protein VNW97_20905 [Candidatus Saccharimonadales bacterium]|jgi:hypothetical protein|nr:hypothetical protein [Candidatus Saccharimonadales bacterium]
MELRSLLFVLLLASSACFSRAAKPFSATAASVANVGEATPWADWGFLLGNWTLGEGGGKPGQGASGTVSFTVDLQGHVIVRKNHSEYASVNGKPPVIHDDRMTIYEEGGATRAIYWDNEGHVIHYTVGLSADKKKITFLSDKTPGAPAFRLTYEDAKPGTVYVGFEIAPPDKPDQFAMYVQGTMVRR